MYFSKVKLIQLLFKPLVRFGINPSVQSAAIWSMLESFSGPVFSLILIPVLTYSLGLDKYGVYVMTMAFVNLFSFTGLGMSTSITYYLSLNQQVSSRQNIAGRVGTALSISLIGTVIFSIIAVFVFNFSASEIQKAYPQLIKNQTLVYIVCLLIISTQYDAVISSSLKGLQQFKASSKLEFVIRLLGFIAVSVVAIIQKDVLAVIFTVVVVSLFSLLLRWSALSRLINLHWSNVRLNRQYLAEFFHFGKWMTLQNISGAIFGSLDKLVLGFFHTTTDVGKYNIIISITQLSHYILSSALSFLLPKISANINNLKTLQKYYHKSLMICGLFTLVIIIILITLYPFLVRHFNLGDLYLEYFILVVSYGWLAMTVSPYYYSLGLGGVKVLSNVNTISAFLGIVTVVYFVADYGILGAVISRFAYTAAVTLTFLIPPFLFKSHTLSKK